MNLTAKAIQNALKKIEMEAEIHHGPKELPLEEILVPLGREMVMQIGLLQNGEGQLQFLQFLIMIPLKIEKAFLAETQSYINLINAVIELPGFGVIESEQMPFFRYTMTCHRKEIDEELFLLTVGLILYVIDTYLEMLEEIATGKKRFTDLLAAVESKRHKSQSFPDG